MNWKNSRGRQGALGSKIAEISRPQESEGDKSPLLEAIGDAQFVLLGEASHGTSEYYTWRARLTRRLIVEKGFSFVAVEGDWPDCYQINRYAHRSSAALRCLFIL